MGRPPQSRLPHEFGKVVKPMTKILTITLNPTIDISSEAEVVRPIRKIRTVNTRYDPGGGGINVARVIAMLGGDAEAIFLAGGEIGSLLDRLLKEEGVRHRLIAIAGQTRIAVTILEKTTGLEYRFVPEGPNVSEQELQACFDFVASQSWNYVVISGSLPLGIPGDSYARIVNSAAPTGARVVLDSSGLGLQTTLEKSRVFLVKPSRGELEKLVGLRLDEDGVRQAAAGIVARGAAELVAVTLGADGALLASSSGVLRIPAVPVRVRSAVGAGDSFLGAMTWALSEGKGPEEAFKLGVAAGAAAVMTPGKKLCLRSDVYKLIESINREATSL
jgi:6-phosphofructokinase 2